MKKSIDSTAENTEPSDKLEFSKEKENSISIDEQFQTFLQLVGEDHTKAPWFNKLF